MKESGKKRSRDKDGLINESESGEWVKNEKGEQREGILLSGALASCRRSSGTQGSIWPAALVLAHRHPSKNRYGSSQWLLRMPHLHPSPDLFLSDLGCGTLPAHSGSSNTFETMRCQPGSLTLHVFRDPLYKRMIGALSIQ